MARRKMSLEVRYADVIGYWQQAANEDGVKFQCKSSNDAIYINHRLNKYRAIVRDDDAEGLTILDSYIVRIQGSWITILRRPLPDYSKVLTLDGRPAALPSSVSTSIKDQVTPEQLEMVRKWGNDPEWNRSMDAYCNANPHLVDPRKVLAAMEALVVPQKPEPPKLHEHDPSKPLIDC